MTMTAAPAEHRQYLRVQLDVLNGLLRELDQPATDGGDVLARLALRREAVLSRLTELNGHADRVPGGPRPVVLDPATLASLMSHQGQPLVPVITTDAAPTLGLSSAQVWMPPWHTSRAHLHYHTGVGVLVLQGAAVTLWWDEHGVRHELPQLAGQHLFIPAGVPHAAINPHDVPVVAAEFRDNPVFNADNELLPELDDQVAARLAAARPAA
jgi:uncharacterized RmlC-like cupin family protein